MAWKEMRPVAPASAHGPREMGLLGSLTYPEFATTTADLQARKLRERFPISKEVARIVAELAFERRSPR